MKRMLCLGFIFTVAMMIIDNKEVVAQTTLPPVVVTANYIGGGQAICYGSACAAILAEMSSTPDYWTEAPPMEDQPINKTAFCNALRNQKPQDCGSTAPSTPSFDPGWSGNGCGPADWSTWTQSAINTIINNTSEYYSGNMNAPYAGVDFMGACNEHDRCYGSPWQTSGQQSAYNHRISCDAAFGQQMLNACAANTISGSPARGVCDTMASTYRGAVGNLGESSYQKAQKEHQCALWHREMEGSECSQN